MKKEEEKTQFELEKGLQFSVIYIDETIIS